MITIWNNVYRLVSEVKVKTAVEGSLKVRLWYRIVMGLKHMEAPPGIVVCGKRLIAEEHFSFGTCFALVCLFNEFLFSYVARHTGQVCSLTFRTLNDLVGIA